MILVSACLVGINCKYSGDNNSNDRLKEYLNGKDYIIACPEQLGGLTTPREPSEIDGSSGVEVLNGRVKIMSKSGQDVTDAFKKGAYETLKIAKLYSCDEAILKEGSPSCGSSLIYDGSFKGVKVSGEGVTTALLRKNGIIVKSDKDF